MFWGLLESAVLKRNLETLTSPWTWAVGFLFALLSPALMIGRRFWELRRRVGELRQQFQARWSGGCRACGLNGGVGRVGCGGDLDHRIATECRRFCRRSTSRRGSDPNTASRRNCSTCCDRTLTARWRPCRSVRYVSNPRNEGPRCIAS